MILSIGKQSQNNKAGIHHVTNLNASKDKFVTGFTFIEIILTVLIILVIIGLSTPMFRRTYYDLRVNLQARDISGLMRLAKEKAIMTRVPHLVKLDERKNTYRMFTLDTEKDKPMSIEGKWGKSFVLFSDLKIDSSTEEIKFFPDGSSSGASISLNDFSGLKARITIEATSGEITVGTAQEK